MKKCDFCDFWSPGAKSRSVFDIFDHSQGNNETRWNQFWDPLFVSNSFGLADSLPCIAVSLYNLQENGKRAIPGGDCSELDW